MGAWFEAQVAKVTVKTTDEESSSGSPGTDPQSPLYYHVVFDELV